MKPKEWSVEVPLIISGIIWGSSFVTSKVGVENMDPLVFSLLRYAFASATIIPVLMLFKHFDRKVLANPWIILISVLNALAIALQNVSMTTTTATNAVLLININIVYIALLAVFILKERLTKRIIIGLCVGLFGAFIISTNGNFSSLGGGNTIGNAMALAAGLLWAFYVIFLTKALKAGVEQVSATMVTILYSMLILIPLTLVSQPSYHINATALEMAAYAGVMCTTVAFLLYTYGLRALGATTASIILLLEMVFGMFFAIIFLNEIPSLATAIGAGFVLSAVFILSFKKKRKAAKQPIVQE